MNLESFLKTISFQFVHPQSVPGSDGWFQLQRSNGTTCRLLPLPGGPLDRINTCLGEHDQRLKACLHETASIPRMSAFAMGAIIQSATATLRGEDAFVNIGLWQGFTFLSGVIGNPDKRCIGVDNFSQYGGPREAFAARFERLKGPKHEFRDMDYRDYFEQVHRGPIGFYIYDGEHSYENQLLGLQIAEPYFTDDCIVLVDDTNWPEPRRAIRDFVAQSPSSYRVLFDEPTFPYSGRLTFWNGCTVLQRTTGSADFDYPEQPRRGVWGEAAAESACTALPDKPLVTLVLLNADASHDPIAATTEAPTQASGSLEVISVNNGAQPDDLQNALDRSRGDFVAFVDAGGAVATDTIDSALESGARLAAWVAREMHVARHMTQLIAPGEQLILADEQQFNRQVADGRRCLPFIECNGRYWGNPVDSNHAIKEVDRLCKAGARYFVLGWPVFWWLKHYPEFMRHLELSQKRLHADDNLIVFELVSR